MKDLVLFNVPVIVMRLKAASIYILVIISKAENKAITILCYRPLSITRKFILVSASYTLGIDVLSYLFIVSFSNKTHTANTCLLYLFH